jgi:hypothetical protein
VARLTVVTTLGLVAYKLDLPVNLKMHNVFHVSLLKRYHADSITLLPPPPELIKDTLEYDVETILDHRDTKDGRKKVREYLVKWLAYNPEHNTCREPEENVSNCLLVLRSYWAQRNNVRSTRPAKRTNRQRPEAAPVKRRRRLVLGCATVRATPWTGGALGVFLDGQQGAQKVQIAHDGQTDKLLPFRTAFEMQSDCTQTTLASGAITALNSVIHCCLSCLIVPRL